MRSNSAIQALHLENSPSKNLVTTCIKNYAKPSGLANQLGWLLYRVVQAVKSLFGVSDWQKALAVCRGHVREMALGQGLIIKNPSSKREKNAQDTLIFFINEYTKHILALTLFIEENLFNVIDVEEFLHEMSRTVTSIRSVEAHHRVPPMTK